MPWCLPVQISCKPGRGGQAACQFTAAAILENSAGGAQCFAGWPLPASCTQGARFSMDPEVACCSSHLLLTQRHTRHKLLLQNARSRPRLCWSLHCHLLSRTTCRSADRIGARRPAARRGGPAVPVAAGAPSTVASLPGRLAGATPTLLPVSSLLHHRRVTAYWTTIMLYAARVCGRRDCVKVCNTMTKCCTKQGICRCPEDTLA